MRRIQLVCLLLLCTTALLKAQPPKSFGGVWLGQSTFTKTGRSSMNVGSFFLAKAPLIRNLYFGYAISANTNVAAESAVQTDLFGNVTAATATGVGIHMPLELNLAYLLSFGKFSAWAGGGLNASIAQAEVYLSYMDFGNGLYCEASATGQTRFVPGAQVFVGGEYKIGGMPYVGGNWGVFLQYKQMFVQRVNMRISGTASCVDNLGNSYSDSFEDSIDIDLSSGSFVLGLTYHF